MTKKLEELLNLPDSKDIVNDAKKEEKKTKAETVAIEQVETMRDIAEFDKIASALPSVKGLGKLADDELNDIADKALASYDDLMDLGMNVESRYASRVFEVAGGMLKTGLDAKVAKLNNKLKMVELQLKKQAIDQKANSNPDGNVVDGDGYVVSDRNSLLEKLKNLDK